MADSRKPGTDNSATVLAANYSQTCKLNPQATA